MSGEDVLSDRAQSAYNEQLKVRELECVGKKLELIVPEIRALMDGATKTY